MRPSVPSAVLACILGLGVFAGVLWWQKHPHLESAPPERDRHILGEEGDRLRVRYAGQVQCPEVLFLKCDPALPSSPECDAKAAHPWCSLAMDGSTKVALTGAALSIESYDGRHVEVTGTIPRTSSAALLPVRVDSVRPLDASSR